METLSLANPAAFARTGRVTRLVTAIAEDKGLGGWELEVASMLSQIGAVTVGAEIVGKIEAGESLTAEERHAVDAVPSVSERLLASIPRLEEVRRIIRFQDRRYDGSGGSGADALAGQDLPIGSRILKIALDLEALESQGRTRDAAIRELRTRRGHYDPNLVDDLETIIRAPVETDRVEAGGLVVGMVIEADVYDTGGVLLVPRGREITENLLPVIVGYAMRGRVTGTFTVSGPAGEDDDVI
jgi:response regulator RpfG family c-di-GMP phosphodiesterase